MSTTQTLTIGQMTCAACVGRVEKVLRRVPGVESAEVNLMTGRATVHTRPDVNFAALQKAVEAVGYTAKLPSKATPEPESMAIVLWSAALTLPIMLPMLSDSLGLPMTPGWLQAVLAGVVQVWMGSRFVRSGWHGLRNGAANMDLLVALGSWAAFGLSVVVLCCGGPLYFESGALVITLVLLGRHLEGRARLQAGAAIRALSQLQPEQALVRRKGADLSIDLDDIRLGEVVVVRPGERVPVDGRLLEGSGAVDVSHLTGESLPVERAPGDAMLAGSINGSNLLLVQAERLGAETMLGQMIRLVESAQAQKPAVQKLADRISAVFVPVVLVLALATLAGWWLAGAAPAAMIFNAISVLVVACPCALGLAAPAAVMAGMGAAARAGIMIRNPDVLARAKSAAIVVFDKTGTLSEGRPALVATLGVDPGRALRLAASLQSGSTHPLAHAVLEAVKTEVKPALAMQALPGRGVAGEVDGLQLRLGHASLLDDAGLSKGALANDEARLMNDGCSVSWLISTAPTQAVLGLLAFTDPVKPQAAAAIAGLRAQGLRTIMLSGDNAGSVAITARATGIDEAHANVLPEGKARFIADLRQSGCVVMVGDGINDAPALAEADISMAMGSGTDIAMQTADITLMRGDLHLVAAALDITQRTQAKVWQGLLWAFGFNACALPLAALGYLTPALSGGAMAFSSLAVVLNALVLSRWRPKPQAR